VLARSCVDGKDFIDLPILVKTKARRPRTHLAGGARGSLPRHLTKSATTCSSAPQRLHRRDGQGRQPAHRRHQPAVLEDRPRAQRRRWQWIVVGDENYGEGSSREHGAGRRATSAARPVLVRSFALSTRPISRAGRAAADLADPADYDKFEQGDACRSPVLHPRAGQAGHVQIRKPDGRWSPSSPHSMTKADRLVPRGLRAERRQVIDPKTVGAGETGSRASRARRHQAKPEEDV